jgi:glutathione reductase (NADPH)
MTSYDYDLLVIGGGSGGISASKRSATHGKKAAVIERARWGGTCVNVDYVPKKIMWLQTSMYEMMKHDAIPRCRSIWIQAAQCGIGFCLFKKKCDAYILKLNTIYSVGLEKSGVEKFIGDATFVDAHTVAVTKEDGTISNVMADKIVIAFGGRPDLPESTPGMEHCISSDEFFDLEALPKKAVIVEAWYIAVGLAGVLNALGVNVHLVVRRHKAIRTFDECISDHLGLEMLRRNITIHRNTNELPRSSWPMMVPRWSF